jgi:hypothetical protein
LKNILNNRLQILCFIIDIYKTSDKETLETDNPMDVSDNLKNLNITGEKRARHFQSENNIQDVQQLYETPTYAIRDMIKYILCPGRTNEIINSWTIFDPCCGNSAFKHAFEELGYSTKFIEQDLFTLPEKKDFFNSNNIPKEYTHLITNPPYKFKYNFLLQAYKSNKPFILLLPYYTTECRNCAELFSTYGVIIYQPFPHIKFIHDGNLVEPCSTAWFVGNIPETKCAHPEDRIKTINWFFQINPK